MSATVTRETFYCLQIILLRGTLKNNKIAGAKQVSLHYSAWEWGPDAQ